VPVSVTALTADQLKDQRVGDVLALSGLSPGLQIKTDDNAANPRIFIRGIGVNDFNPSTASAVGVYVDGVYVASPLAQMAGFYDLQQVEVLRGPQGTLYGRNTTGGAINVTTKKPSTRPRATWRSTTAGSIRSMSRAVSAVRSPTPWPSGSPASTTRATAIRSTA
jgi:iron complex outermembrane receptor protein